MGLRLARGNGEVGDVVEVETEAEQEAAAARRLSSAAQKRWSSELRRLRVRTAGVAGPPPSPDR